MPPLYLTIIHKLKYYLLIIYTLVVSFSLNACSPQFTSAFVNGLATVGWGNIVLTEQLNGDYENSLRLLSETPRVINTPVSVIFLDRAGNVASSESEQKKLNLLKGVFLGLI